MVKGFISYQEVPYTFQNTSDNLLNTFLLMVYTSFQKQELWMLKNNTMLVNKVLDKWTRLDTNLKCKSAIHMPVSCIQKLQPHLNTWDTRRPNRPQENSHANKLKPECHILSVRKKSANSKHVWYNFCGRYYTDARDSTG